LDEEKITASSQQRPPTNEEKKKAPVGKVVEVVAEAQTGKLNFTPHCINVRTGPFPTLNELFSY
jgi:hypothetical protein